MATSVSESESIESDKNPSYRDMIAICMGWFGLSLTEARRCTPLDFDIYMKAREYRRQERMEEISIQAWKNREIQSDKKVGKNYKPYFKTFKDFYDSSEEIDKLLYPQPVKPKNKQLTSADMNRILAKVGKEEING